MTAVSGAPQQRNDVRRDVLVARWVATIAGLIGFVLSVLTPFLPVVQTTATLNWPQAGAMTNVTAPLISQVPVTLTADIPCEVIRSMPPDGGLVLGTAPPDGKQAALHSLLVTVSSKQVDITDRNVVIASVPRSEVASPECQRIEITSSEEGTFATFVGLKKDSGESQDSAPGASAGGELHSGFPDPNLRPSIVGVFTDLTGPAPPGLSFSAVIDTRFSTSPTPLKLTAMLVAIAATVVALLALWRLDRTDGRRMHRLIPARWRYVTTVDGVVIGGFLVWHVMGANSSDDGYILAMARVADTAGYMSNYFRWFGSPEDPFGWYYNLLALMTHVSDASIWIRLPSLLAALISWILLSREVLPRLGPAVAGSRAAVWAAGLVLLTAWMPFNNGLRPEPIIAVGALITWVLIERAIISNRLAPAALAIVTAAFTLGIQPTGLIAVAALIAGGRPLLRILVRRHRVVGTWPLIAPLLAAGFVVLTVVFADQTMATVLEATRIRTAIGPSEEWYTENLRYYYLILPTVDGSLSRRFGFLITALALFTSMFIMLRRKRIPGVASGPAWRLMGVIFATIFLLMFMPTKWVHHFGLFAAVGAAMAALATVLVSPKVLRWSRNRMAVVTAVLFLLALCFATTNGWWYVSSYGIPFNNAMPRIAGISISSIFLAMAVIAGLYAMWLHFASRERGNGPVVRAVTTAPIAVAAGIMAVVFVGSMTAGVIRQYPTYSNGWANIRALSGGCGLADFVLVEPDPNEGALRPLESGTAKLGPLGGADPVGFGPNGVPENIVAEAIWQLNPLAGTDYDWDAPTELSRPGINGSTVPLPYGLNPARTPVLGSYKKGAQQQSTFTSSWYELPAADDGHPLVVVTAAGTISGNSVFNGYTEGQTVQLEYGTAQPDGSFQPTGRLEPYDLGPTPSWRNLRFPRSDIPSDAAAVRLVVADLSLTPGDWVAVTPPRAPQLQTVQEYVGSQQPVLMDWAVGLAFPCQEPMLHHNGVTEVPAFRITPDYNAKRLDTDSWEDGMNGGLLGITDLLLRAQVMATYLDEDWGRDWGSLRKFSTIEDADVAKLDLGTATRGGMWKSGQIRIGP